MDDSVSFQVYNGIGRQPATDQAVDETRGQIMTWGGEPITAYFFSTSCGYTSTSEVWGQGNSEEYLKSVYLEATRRKMSRQRKYSPPLLLRKIRMILRRKTAGTAGKPPFPRQYWDSRLEPYGIGTLQEMTVRRRSSGGAVTELLLTPAAAGRRFWKTNMISGNFFL